MARLMTPQGHVRLLLEEGPPLAVLLRAAASDGAGAGYDRRILATLGTCGDKAPASVGPVDPLSA
jgi:LuxR family maltose regulon positive regulatory protein